MMLMRALLELDVDIEYRCRCWVYQAYFESYRVIDHAGG